MKAFRRSSESEPTSPVEDVQKKTPALPDVTDALSAILRWLDGPPGNELPACAVAVDRDGDIELTWHEASVETTRKVISTLPGHWEFKFAGFVYLSTTVEIDANSSHYEIRPVKCTIFPVDGADLTSLVTVSA